MADTGYGREGKALLPLRYIANLFKQQTLDQLEIGRSYELVVTTLAGLYRYKTYKHFMVVGRYHDTPTVIIDK